MGCRHLNALDVDPRNSMQQQSIRTYKRWKIPVWFTSSDYANLTYTDDNQITYCCKITRIHAVVHSHNTEDIWFTDVFGRLYEPQVSRRPSQTLSLVYVDNPAALEDVLDTLLYENEDYSEDLFNVHEASSWLNTDVSQSDTAYYIRQVHSGRRIHSRAKRTWCSLNKQLIGHLISFVLIAQYITACTICQKFSKYMLDYIEPIRMYLKVDQPKWHVDLHRQHVSSRYTKQMSWRAISSHIIWLWNLW